MVVTLSCECTGAVRPHVARGSTLRTLKSGRSNLPRRFHTSQVDSAHLEERPVDAPRVRLDLVHVHATVGGAI